MTNQDPIDEIMQTLFDSVSNEITEGLVRSERAAPYRRLDCHGRALAFVRRRPRKNGVRVDISTLWLLPELPAIAIPARGVGASLMLRTMSDVAIAVAFLAATVECTRAAHEAHRARYFRSLRSEPGSDSIG